MKGAQVEPNEKREIERVENLLEKIVIQIVAS